jgi:hypothetical protein
VIPGVIERRAVVVHEPLLVIPLQHDPAGDVPLLGDLNPIPEILVVAGDLQGLGLVGV